MRCPQRLRHDLVLEVDLGGDTGPLVSLDLVRRNVETPAVAVVRVRDQRQAARIGDAGSVVDHLRHRQPDVRHAQPHTVVAPAPAHVNCFEPVPRYQLRVQRIRHAGGHQHTRSRDQLA